MNSTKLVSSTAEIALNLIEKRGVAALFCKAVSEDGVVFIYSPDTTEPVNIDVREAEDRQRKAVLQEIHQRRLVGLAFCKVVNLTMTEPDEVVDAIRVEIHHVDSRSLVYFL